MLCYLPYCQINGAVFIGDDTRQCGLILSKVPSAIHLKSGSIEQSWVKFYATSSSRQTV